MAMAAGFERVFEIGPVFRADPSFTSRHMTEFTGVDMEISWVDSHDDVMSFMESWLAYCYAEVKAKHGDQIKSLLNVDIVVPEVPFPRISMRDSYAILKAPDINYPQRKKVTLTQELSVPWVIMSKRNMAMTLYLLQIGHLPPDLSTIWFILITRNLPVVLTCSGRVWK
jgi:aspartyl/asparaginyl-tRNA synthetase